MAGRPKRRRKNAAVKHWRIVGRDPRTPGSVQTWAEGFASKKGAGFDMRRAQRAGWLDLRVVPVYDKQGRTSPRDARSVRAYEDEQYGRADRSHRSNMKRKNGKSRTVTHWVIADWSNGERTRYGWHTGRNGRPTKKNLAKLVAGQMGKLKHAKIVNSDGDAVAAVAGHAPNPRSKNASRSNTANYGSAIGKVRKLKAGASVYGKPDSSRPGTKRATYFRKTSSGWRDADNIPVSEGRVAAQIASRMDWPEGRLYVAQGSSKGSQRLKNPRRNGNARKRNAAGKRNTHLAVGQRVGYTLIPGVFGKVLKAGTGDTYDVKWSASGQIQHGIVGSRLKKA